MDYNSVYIQNYKFIYKQQNKLYTFKDKNKKNKKNINKDIFSGSIHSLGMFRTDLQVFVIERYLDLSSQQ